MSQGVSITIQRTSQKLTEKAYCHFIDKLWVNKLLD
jgi:hypothetical protein